MAIMFDVEAIMTDPTLNTLTWEIIQARGIDVGDLAKLFETAVQMGEACANCFFRSEQWLQPIEYGEEPSIAEMEIAATYALMSKFMAREAREMVKFLQLRGFEFPEGTTGKRPPDAIGF